VSAKLRILHLFLGADAGGLSQYILDMMNAMQAQGHEVTVAGDSGAWLERFPADSYHRIPLKEGFGGFRNSVRQVRKLLDQQPVDILHTHYRRATLLARKLKTRLPILYTLHLSHLSLRWPRRWLSDWGDHCHVASSDARDWLINQAGVLPDHITLIPHGVQVDRFPIATAESRAQARAAMGLGEAGRVALFVGRFDYPKNEQWLVDLALAARTRLPQLKVLMVGSGPNEAALRQRISRESVEQHVQVIGDSDLLGAYHAADALLLPSLREGFSMVCAEAMSCGIPCLRTCTSGTRELIIQGTTGISVPIEHNAFVEGSLEFLSDPDGLKRMGLAASRHIREHFTFQRQLDRTIDLYHRLANRT
jgi:glycosyltransferase involved in cell wall biosynthesis